MFFDRYFKKEFGVSNPGEVTWAHSVNSQQKLDNALHDSSVMMIESDIGVSSTGTLVAVHPPETTSDLGFVQLIKKIQSSNKGLKLDFKEPKALLPCLQLLNSVDFEQPLMLNADVLQGNRAIVPKFAPSKFINICKEYMPSVILSLGWTTSNDPHYGYTQENINEMKMVTEGIDSVTYPVRACLLPQSWQNISQLIQKEGHTITIWNGEPLGIKLIDWIRNNTSPLKTFYDLVGLK